MKTSEVFNMRIDSEVMNLIRAIAKNEQRTVANMIRVMINDYLNPK